MNRTQRRTFLRTLGVGSMLSVAGCNEVPATGSSEGGDDEKTDGGDTQGETTDQQSVDVPSDVEFHTRRYVGRQALAVTLTDDVDLQASEVVLTVGSRTATWARVGVEGPIDRGDSVYLAPDGSPWQQPVESGDTLEVAVEGDGQRKTIFERTVAPGTRPSLNCLQRRYGPEATGYHPDSTGPTDRPDHWWLRKFDTWQVKSPLVVDGTVIVGTSNGLFGLDGTTLDVRWHAFSDHMVTPTVADGTVYATIGSLEEGIKSLVALDLGDQTEQWRAASLGQRWTTEVPVPTLNVVGDSVLVGEPGSAHCYDANSGAHRWSYRVPSGTGSGISADQDLVYLAGGDNGMEAIDLATGELGWRQTRRPGEGNLTPPAVGKKLLFFFDQKNGGMYSWAIKSWDRNWKVQLEQGGVGGVALAGDTVYCTINERTRAFDALSGEELWSTEIDLGRPSEPVVADGHVYFTATPFDRDRRALEGSWLFVLDAGDGTVVWEQQLTKGLPKRTRNDIVGFPQPPTVLDDVLLVPNVKGSIHRLESI